MKKRVLSGVAALGLLLLGAAGLPQEPVSSDPVVRQTPPTFRDVLRGRVGQKCQVLVQAGEWTLTFPPPGSPAVVRGEGIERAEAERVEAEQQLRELADQLDKAQEQQREALEVRRDELLSQLSSLRATERRLRQGQRQGRSRVPNMLVRTLVAVGADFVQLRYEDGRERYVPLGRVKSVINTPE